MLLKSGVALSRLFEESHEVLSDVVGAGNFVTADPGTHTPGEIYCWRRLTCASGW